MKVPLWKRDLDVGLSECSVDREAKIRRYAPVHARVFYPDQQRKLEAGIAEIVESNLRGGIAKDPGVLFGDADEHVSNARCIRAVGNANFDG